MTGLIWLIQLVHYPSFKSVDDNLFKEFHKFHSLRITFIVGPIMLVELITGGLLLLNDSSALLIANLVLLVLIWLSTAVYSIPTHNKLQHGKNLKIISKLVNTNWPRTILWSIRLCLLLALVTQRGLYG